MQAANPRRGYILGLSAYVIWGLFPLYFKAIASVPAAMPSAKTVSMMALSRELRMQIYPAKTVASTPERASPMYTS